MTPALEVVTEEQLSAFREEHLSPGAVLALIERWVKVLLRLPVGVGKTYAVQVLLLFESLYQRFDLVIYAAPSWSILDAVIARLREAGATGWKVLEPRPTENCGELDEEWKDFESRSCSALAKKMLCKERCPLFKSCGWPKQMQKAKLAGVRLVLMTDQRLGLIRQITPLLQRNTEARRVLVILDEARVLDGNFEVIIAPEDVGRFRETVRRTRGRKNWPAVQAAWVADLDRLLSCDRQARSTYAFQFDPELHKFAYLVQQKGTALSRTGFRYVGYDLSLLASSRPEERWLGGDEYRFIGRPYLDHHLLLLSAHVSADYAGHRLGREPIPSPFEHIRFRHTGSRLINVRSSLGADRHFPSNSSQILSTFAVLIARNIGEGRSTLLISRKKSKQLCADYLERRLRGWGLDVRFVVDDYDVLGPHPDPSTIPIIHYGVLGVNNFTEYEGAYCVNSYYVNPAELNRAVQEFEPRHFRVGLEIVRGTDRIRRVQLADPEVADEDRTWLGAVYLRKLEVDPVIQAAGRVRFLTKAREVVFFQQNDLEQEIGPVEDVPSLASLCQALGIPTAREIDYALVGREARRLLDEGLTGDQAAAELGISRATLYRRLEAAECLRFP